MDTDRHSSRLWVAAPAVALLAAGMWLAWLGWDHDYYVVDGMEHGPYRAWQVVGCGLSIAVGAAVAQWWVRGGWSVFVLAASGVIGFAVPWTWDAAASDDSGLFMVGLVMLLVGGGAGLTVLLAVVEAVAGRRRRTS